MKNHSNEGAESIVTFVTKDKGSFVVKTRRPRGKTQYPFEAYAYEATRALGSHVPVVVSVTDTELVMSKLNGETLDDKPELYDTVSIFDAIARDLARNKNVTFKGYGKATVKNGQYVGEYDTWSSYLDSVYAQLVTSTLFSDKQKKRLQAAWRKRKPTAPLTHGVLVHGDFALSAVMVNNGRYEGIIDYGDAFIGDPLMDLAYFRFKEITKEYGYKTYRLLADSYATYAALDRKTIDAAVAFYMLYWGVVRTHADNLDAAIVDKFIEKTLYKLPKM